MRYNIGEIVHNQRTQESAQVVRIAETEFGCGYIVSVLPHPNWGIPATEALWPESEVKNIGAERVPS
ncbi:MAG: hypothetical protein WAL56_00045 [Candidatus Sulfotelmatobacter sp.]